MADLNLDSLMAMELRHTLKRDLNIDLPVMQILRVQNVSAMITMLTELMVKTEAYQTAR